MEGLGSGSGRNVEREGCSRGRDIEGGDMWTGEGCGRGRNVEAGCMWKREGRGRFTDVERVGRGSGRDVEDTNHYWL